MSYFIVALQRQKLFEEKMDLILFLLMWLELETLTGKTSYTSKHEINFNLKIVFSFILLW